MITNSDLDLIPLDLVDALAPTDPSAPTALIGPTAPSAPPAPCPDDDDRDGSPRDAM